MVFLPKDVEEKLKPDIEKFKAEMKAKGYPKGLIEKAIDRAKGYVAGISKFTDHRHPELMKRVQVEMFPEALEHSKRWMENILKAIAGEKLEEVV